MHTVISVWQMRKSELRAIELLAEGPQGIMGKQYFELSSFWLQSLSS